MATLSALAPAMNHREDARNKKERREGSENQSANHGATKRGILFAPFAETDGHGDHTDNHGERGHEHGADAHKARL